MTDTSRFQHLKRGAASEYTLVSESGETQRLECLMWMAVRNAAALVGSWRPAGTEAPANWDPETPWPGSYDTTEGQLVTAADALALAEALSKLGSNIVAVADDMKDKIQQVPAEARQLFQGMLQGSGVPQELLEAHMAAFFAGFAAFCRKGAFCIR
jgi:hypothetical protein